jgi:hypothetical protein
MTNFRQAITVKYYGPTNTKPSRLRASSHNGNDTMWASWDNIEGSDSDASRYTVAALAYASRYGWRGDWYGGVVATGDYVFVRVDACTGTPAFTVDKDSYT